MQDSLSFLPHEEEHRGPTPLVTLETLIKPQLQTQEYGLFHKPFPHPGPKGAKQTLAMLTSPWVRRARVCQQDRAQVHTAQGWAVLGVLSTGERGWWEASGQAGVGLSGERSPEDPVSSK